MASIYTLAKAWSFSVPLTLPGGVLIVCHPLYAAHSLQGASGRFTATPENLMHESFQKGKMSQ